MTRANGEMDLRIISLGAGVQSSALYLMALDGLLTPMPDLAIFADTQQEPPWVYENVWRLAAEGGDRIPIVVATAGDLGDAVKRRAGASAGRFASVPFWTPAVDGGRASPGRRQCTREHKIDVVKQEIRRQLGVGFRQRATKYRVEEWIGISADEAIRAKPSRAPWIKTRWPFLFDRHMRRAQIVEWLRARGWPEIKKSACVFCPYRQPVEYARWRDEEPALFEEACRWDELIRDSSRAGLRQPQYLTRLLKPLREIPTVAELTKRDDAQADLFGNECEGMCGV
jgi:hypothetical protein